MIYLAVFLAIYKNDDDELFDRAIQSIFDQNIPVGYEIRIYLGIDGPIGNNLERVIKKYEEKIYLIYRSNSNQGLAKTLNSLILNLESEAFIFRMDSDDFSLPNRFRNQLKFFKNHPDIDIVGTDIHEWDFESNIYRFVSYAFNHDDAFRKITRRVPVAHPTVCFRRSVFSVVDKYPEVRENEDIAMWFNCMKAGLRFGNVHKPLLIFSLNKSFWDRRSFPKALKEFKCYMRGIWMLYGFSWRYIFPILRLLLRISPTFLSKFLYKSRLRSL